MKMTLLAMTQDILSDMDSDEVNSITDTVESLQVAQIIKTTFYELIDRKDWAHLRKLAPLESVSDSSKPNYLKLPDRVSRMEQLKYNKQRNGETRIRYEDVKYKYPDEFLRLVQQRNNDNDNVDIITGFNGTQLMILNDRAPEWWTSFDDEYIVFDNYDSAVESTVQGLNSQSVYFEDPTFTFEDNFTPDLPSEAFSLLLAEAKSASSLKLRQMPDQKAEQQATRQNYAMSQRGWKAQGGIRYPNYGRRPSKMHSSTGRWPFDKDSYTG